MAELAILMPSQITVCSLKQGLQGPFTMSIVFTELLHNTVRPAISDKSAHAATALRQCHHLPYWDQR